MKFLNLLLETAKLEQNLLEEDKASDQAARFAKIADAEQGKGNMFLNPKAIIHITNHLLKIGRIEKSMSDDLKGSSSLEEFKKKLKEIGIIMEWDGDMKIKPTFSYPKEAMIDGSELSDGGKYKSW
jgi:hypothetical protein